MRSTNNKYYGLINSANKFLLTTVIILFAGFTDVAQNTFSSGLPQELKYEVRGMYRRPVKKERLSEAKFISDVISGYPVNWVTQYISVEIQGTLNGKTVKAIGVDETLNPEQRNILNAVELGNSVTIGVKYNYKNPVTHDVEKSIIHVSLTAVPEIEAQYVGGDKQMISFLKENASGKISEITQKPLQPLTIRFTVNEEGEIENTTIFKTSGDQKVDRLLLDLIINMPKWKPAQNAKGIKVKQDFELILGNTMTGC